MSSTNLENNNVKQIGNKELESDNSNSNYRLSPAAREVVKYSIKFGDTAGEYLDICYKKYGIEVGLKAGEIITHISERLTNPSVEALKCGISLAILYGKNKLGSLSIIQDILVKSDLNGDYSAEISSLGAEFGTIYTYYNLTKSQLQNDLKVFSFGYSSLSIQEKVQEIPLQHTTELRRCLEVSDRLNKIIMSIDNLDPIDELISDIRILCIKI